MVRYKTDTLRWRAPQPAKTSHHLQKVYRPASGKPAIISPDKITVSEGWLYATYIDDAAKYRSQEASSRVASGRQLQPPGEKPGRAMG